MELLGNSEAKKVSQSVHIFVKETSFEDESVLCHQLDRLDVRGDPRDRLQSDLNFALDIGGMQYCGNSLLQEF